MAVKDLARLREAEQALVGKRFSPALASEAGARALQGARPGTHNKFRIELGQRVVADALMLAAARS